MSDNPWRLYHREWVTVHTVTLSTTDPVNVVQQANAWIDKHIKGRVLDTEIQLDVNTDGGILFWCDVKIFKENLRGEFKRVVNAENFANLQNFDEYVIVERNSPEDQKIRNYGVPVS